MTSAVRLSRRSLLASLLATAALPLLPAGGLRAAQPPAGQQVPGVYRTRIGEVEVTALSDGWLELGLELFPGADPAAVRAFQEAAFLPGGALRTSLNTYVLNLGDRLILVDAGAGGAFGPTAGHLANHLAAAGIDPVNIDMVVLTHMHPDHIGGVVGAEGKALFPNAELVVHAAEWDYWHDDAARAAVPDDIKAMFDGIREAAKVFSRMRRFDDGAEIVPGLTAVPLPGHTPGHTGFRLSSDGESLLIWGDVVHAPVMQFARPDWGIAFDVDPDQARQTRSQILAQVADERTLVAGMHLDFPGLGHVTRGGEADAAYTFVPLKWEHDLQGR